MASGATSSAKVSTPDYTRLKPPLELGATGLQQLLQCYQVGTDEIRQTLMQECDVVIECKVCRSLYRGLANFLAHKRSYCKERYAGGLLRFQDMTNKEDEAFVVGTSMFQEEEDDGDEDDFHFGRKSRRKRPGVDTPDSKIYNYFKNIHAAEQNLSKVRSSDHIIRLDVMKENTNAVTQNIASAEKVLEITKDVAKKRKVAEGHIGSPTNPTKFARINGESGEASNADRGLDGVIAKKCGPLSSLKQIFVSQNLCSPGSNSCNKCHSEFSTYKSLKTHIKRLHMKRRTFNQCRQCSKLFIRNDSFVQHLYDDHQFKKEDVMQQILLPKVEKIVIDNSSVFEDFEVKTAPLVKSKPTDSPRSFPKDTSQNDTDWGNDTMDGDHQSDNEDDAASDDPDSLKRGQYLCTKTFWLSVVECLGLYEKAPLRGKTKYICRGHPAMVFTLYTAYKEHILQKHIPKTIQCPVCEESFTKPVHKHFTNFAVHLKTAHHISEMNIMKLSRSLRKSVLGEEMSDSEVDADDAEEAPEEGVDIDPHISEPQDETLDRSEEKGLKLYKCVKCDKTSSAFWGLRVHMMQVHNLTSEECLAEKVSIVQNAVYQQRRQINRRRAVNLESGIASTFNLEDFYCPLCFRNYPKVCQVIGHLLASHGCSKDEADKYKTEIKESRRKQHQTNMQNMSSLGRSQRPRSGAPHYAEDAEEMRSKRKQCSPSKSGSFNFTKATVDDKQEVGSASGKITFKSGFSLYSCKKCNKVFGQKIAMTMHESTCLKEEPDEGETGEVSDQAEMSCEEGVDTSEHQVQSPQGPSILKSMLKASFPALVCRKCNKNFHKKVARISHESRCMKRKSAGPELEVSSDEEEDPAVDSPHHTPTNTDENKNCDKEEASDTEVLCKVYKCPLCDFEDLELHKITDHLVEDHDWSHTKVAARRDTLKRSVVFKQGYKSPSSSDEEMSPKVGGVSDGTPPSHSTSNATGGDVAMSPMTIQDFQCHLCPRVYWDLKRMINHWGVVHSLDAETITALKKKAQDRKQKQLAEFQVLPRSARRSAAEMVAGSPKKVTADTSPGNDSKPKQELS